MRNSRFAKLPNTFTWNLDLPSNYRSIVVDWGLSPLVLFLFEILADDGEGFERKVLLDEVGQVDADKAGVDY